MEQCEVTWYTSVETIFHVSDMICLADFYIFITSEIGDMEKLIIWWTKSEFSVL